MMPQNSPAPRESSGRAVSEPVQAADLTPAAQEYLKLIWFAGEWTTEPVTIGGLAERLRLTASTVSEAVSKLAGQGLVTHAKYGSVELTAAGREYAVLMVRRHRLLETFLVRVLGYGWDEVHLEAEVLEHAVSETTIARIDQLARAPCPGPARRSDPLPGRSGPPAGSRPAHLGDGRPACHDQPGVGRGPCPAALLREPRAHPERGAHCQRPAAVRGGHDGAGSRTGPGHLPGCPGIGRLVGRAPQRAGLTATV